MLKSQLANVVLIAAYLLAVNLLAGYVAVALSYPSLWGGGDVFKEYAVPIPYGWAMMHWLTMAPLAVLLYGLPAWPAVKQQKFRWILLACIAACVAIEFIYGGGRWHRIPFVLFPLIDVTTVLMLSAMYLSFSVLRVLIPAFVVVTTLGYFAPAVMEEFQRRSSADSVEGLTSRNGLLRSVSVYQEKDSTIYSMELLVIVNAGASTESVCIDAVFLYERVLALQEPFDNSKPVVRFMAQLP